ncbi:MAG: Holliday junction branch migration protein RuvA [Planctomycetota bacterium]
MYDHFEGEVVRSSGTAVVLRVAGVGYELLVPVGDAARLSEGHPARLYTILHVADGMPSLIGFARRADRDFARKLLEVSGVGPKMALALFSTFDAASLAGHIRASDLGALRRVRGVGAKTAERICLELRDKVDDLDLGDLPIVSVPRPTALPAAAEDAIAALTTLGYPEKEARQKVEKVLADAPDTPTDRLVKAVLRG